MSRTTRSRTRAEWQRRMFSVFTEQVVRDGVLSSRECFRAVFLSMATETGRPD